MSIWNREFDLNSLNRTGKNTLVEHLNIEFVEIGNDFLVAKMPVTANHVQPMRMLHGGASVVLAETLGSVASWLVADEQKTRGVVGVEINANHLKSVHEGSAVFGKVTPIKVGRKLHVWEIKIYNEDEIICCTSRLTTMVLE